MTNRKGGGRGQAGQGEGFVLLARLIIRHLIVAFVCIGIIFTYIGGFAVVFEGCSPSEKWPWPSTSLLTTPYDHLPTVSHLRHSHNQSPDWLDHSLSGRAAQPSDGQRTFRAYPGGDDDGGGGVNPSNSGEDDGSKHRIPIYVVAGDDYTAPEDIQSSIDAVDVPSILRGTGWMIPDIIDPLNPGSIAIFDHHMEKHPEPKPRLDSIEDSVGNANNNVIVNVLLSDTDISNDVDLPTTKRQKKETPTLPTPSPTIFPTLTLSPTSSPTSECKSGDYQSRRDPSAIRIGSSATRAYSRSPRFTELYQQAADDMIRIVTISQPSLIYNPASEVVPLDVMKIVCNDYCDNSHLLWRNLIPTSDKLIIYAHINNDSNDVEYIGYTTDHEQRIQYHIEDKGSDYFHHRTSIRLIHYDTIPLSVDRQLSGRLIRLWGDIVALNELPPTLTRMYRMFLRSWHRGGVKKQQSGQLLEIGAQRHHNLDSPGEGFMFDANKETVLINYATQAGEILTEIINDAWGESATINPNKPFAISTWKTGAREDALSSAIVATEYILGNQNWKDTSPEALFPNANTEEGIFAAPTSDEDLERGLSNFRSYLSPYAEDSETHSFVLVDTQDYMFNSLDEPQMELCRLGYEFEASILGGEIIVFQKDNSIALLHGHLGIICDSREHIPIADSQRRGAAADALRIARQRAVGDNSPQKFDAIDGSIYKEISDSGLHGSRRFGAAICRDTMYVGDAIAVYGGGLTPPDINYPTSQKARDDWNAVAAPHNAAEDESEVAASWTMQRFTDEVSQRGIRVAVRSLYSFMEAHEHVQDTSYRNQKWASVIGWYHGHSHLQQQVRAEVRDLPDGGDVPRLRASMDVNDRVRADIIDYNNREGSLEDYRVLFVRRDGTYSEDEYAGLSVFNVFTATNGGNKLTHLLKGIAKHRDVNGLIAGFKSVNKVDARRFLAREGHAGQLPPGLTMYKVNLRQG